MSRIGLFTIASVMGLALAAEGAIAAPETSPVSPGQIIEKAPASAWKRVAPSDLMVMDLSPDTRGKARRIVIQLLPAPFSQNYIRNMRMLGAAHFWDNTAVYRVQDNYVVQWGDQSEKKAKPAGLIPLTAADYSAPVPKGFRAIPGIRDVYAGTPGFYAGWPIVREGKEAWPVHCYGAVGVGRNMPPNAGDGAELYAVIGHAPRHLDRNIGVVGRVIDGMADLASLTRGTAEMGFIEDKADITPIRQVRFGNELPAGTLPAYEYLDTDSASFAALAASRLNRRDTFFVKPMGGADLCNVPVPVRRVKR